MKADRFVENRETASGESVSPDSSEKGFLRELCVSEVNNYSSYGVYYG
jgi:hypothetical protein